MYRLAQNASRNKEGEAMRYLAICLFLIALVGIAVAQSPTPTAAPIQIRTNFSAGNQAAQFNFYCELLRADLGLRKPNMTNRECWRRLGIIGGRMLRADWHVRQLNAQKRAIAKAAQQAENSALPLPAPGPTPTTTPSATPTMTSTPSSTATATSTPTATATP